MRSHRPFVPSAVEASLRPGRVPRLGSGRTGNDGGFTLVEVMVALMIFGLIASAGVGILAFSVRAQAATSAKLDDIGALGRQSSLLAADLAQAVNRPARDERGTLLPAFVGDATSVTFVRAGWSNIDGLPRSSLQKVSYRLNGDGLDRIAWPMVDGATALPAAAALTGVQSAQLRYRIAGAWSDRWDGRTAPLPQALELVVTRKDGVTFRQMFLVGSGAPPVPRAPDEDDAGAPGNGT